MTAGKGGLLRYGVVGHAAEAEMRTSMQKAIVRRIAKALLALSVAALSIACASDRAPARPPAFYAEVSVEVELEPSPGDPLVRFGSGVERSVIRWWYAPGPARWRWEMETVGTVIDDGVLLTVAGGDESWEYDDRTNVYRRGVFAHVRFPDGFAVSPVTSAPVGPAHAASVDTLMASWRERGTAPEVVGEATLLGRRTQIVELRGASGGLMRAFVDPERMFIMRWATWAGVTGGGWQSYQAEVTALDYGAEIDAARFTFEPPPGAREADAEVAGSCSGASGPLGGAAFPAEPGFLQPAYAPPGYHTVGTGSESGAGSCEPVAVWALLEAADGGSILLRQRLRPGGVPRLDGSWEVVGSSLDDAHSRRCGDGAVALLWRDGDVVALLQAYAVSLDELLRIAESASILPARSR
ncbi:MAG: hypothetical protein F4152_08345 [Dehalococcoidia bacterium]|nr:hypothetical protein [Dehalococcoidia bacterium]